MTQTELARRAAEYGLPFHQPTIQRIEAGERPVRVDEAVVLSEILRMDMLAALTPSSPEAAARTLAAQNGVAATEMQGVESRAIPLALEVARLRTAVTRELDAYLMSLEGREVDADPQLTRAAELLIDRLSGAHRALLAAMAILAQGWTGGEIQDPVVVAIFPQEATDGEHPEA